LLHPVILVDVVANDNSEDDGKARPLIAPSRLMRLVDELLRNVRR
jgi:hypothetical protein